MHAEYYEISREAAETINTTKQKGGKVIGLIHIYKNFRNSCGQARFNQIFKRWSDIFIYPGYNFKVIDGLITNFHLPKSTLIMLVCAFAGKEKTFKAYKEAVAERYGFFSFGDAMLIM